MDLKDKLDKASVRQEMYAQQSAQNEAELNAECCNRRLEMSQGNSQEKYAQLKHALRECVEYARQEALQNRRVPGRTGSSRRRASITTSARRRTVAARARSLSSKNCQQ